MTPEHFHELALRLPGVVAVPILESVEFRVSNRTFATLGWPAAQWAIVRLSIDDQATALSRGRAFHAEPTPRGQRGVTLVRLRGVEEADLAEVLADAWRDAYRRGEAGAVDRADAALALEA